MTEQHSITPPAELVQEWINEEDGLTAGHIATRAARWGADQELEACINWMKRMGYWGEDGKAVPALRAARRPKPPSLKEQALLAIDTAVADGRLSSDVSSVVRRALEALPDG